MMSTATEVRRDEKEEISLQKGMEYVEAGGEKWEKFPFVCNETLVSKGHGNL